MVRSSCGNTIEQSPVRGPNTLLEAAGIQRRQEVGPLDFYLFPGRQDPLGGNLHIIVFLQGDIDQLLESRVLENLKPFQISERRIGRLRWDTRSGAAKISRDIVMGPLIIRPDGTAAAQPEGQQDRYNRSS